jgi:hypothetical protein
MEEYETLKSALLSVTDRLNVLSEVVKEIIDQNERLRKKIVDLTMEKDHGLTQEPEVD